MTTPILVAGDSYSLEWPKQLAKLVDNPITNISSRGRDNFFIWSSAINYLQKASTKHLVIVGNSFLTRIDTWAQKLEGKEYWDVLGHPERKMGNRSIPLRTFEDKYESWYRTVDICVIWQRYYYDLFCFAHTIKAMGHRCFLFNAARNVMGEDDLNFNFRGYLFNTPYYMWCHKQSNILPGDTFSIPRWCKENDVQTNDTGHILDDGGCLVFAKWLHNQILENKLL